MSEMSHPLFARWYARMAPQLDAEGFAAYRKSLVEGLHGRVIEIGAGAGANLAHYPDTVTGVMAVEPEPYLRGKAREAAPDRVEVVEGVAEDLPAKDGEYDAAVVSLVLCSVRDQARALAEIGRVLKPGGEFRFLEHVRGEGGLARMQWTVDHTIWPLLCGGCHSGRDTVQAVTKAGFRVDTLERFRWPDVRITMPATPHVLGRAVRV